MTRIESLLDALRRGYDGDPWHGSSVAQLLRGVTLAHATARIHPDVHSIAEIVAHLTSWTAEVTRRVQGHDAADPIEGDWPDVSGLDATGWTRLKRDLTASIAALAAAVEAFDPARLDSLVGDERVPEAGTGLSVEQTVLGLVQHLAYHGGQIGLLGKIVAR